MQGTDTEAVRELYLTQREVPRVSDPLGLLGAPFMGVKRRKGWLLRSTVRVILYSD